MPRKKSKAVPEGNGPVLHHDEFGCGEPTMVNLCRILKKKLYRINKNLDRMLRHFDQQDKKLVKPTEKKRATNQRLAGFEHGAR